MENIESDFKVISGDRILLIVSERIGDVIFCTPAIHFLRLNKPDAIIDVIALSTFSAQVFDFNPDIDKTYVLPELSDMKLWREEYDAVVDFHNSPETQTYVDALGSPTWTSPRSGEEHQSVVAMNFVKSFLEKTEKQSELYYRLYPQKEHYRKIKSLLAGQGVDMSHAPVLVGCHMGNYKTTERIKKFWKRNFYSTKTWPSKKFAALQKMLYEKNPQIKIVLTGSEPEYPLSRYLNKRYSNVINLMGKTSVLELTALMLYLKVFLTGDTGPLHVAAATQVPIVAMLGPTCPIKTGPHPLRDEHTVLHMNPLKKLSVDSVYGALERFL